MAAKKCRQVLSQDNSREVRVDIDAELSPHFAGGTSRLQDGFLDASQMRSGLLIEAPAFIG